jgi:tetratricopeptide (TPR) repeat protein
MPDPVFERYKEALRAGHVAMLHGRLKEALKRYGEATELADHRALPHASLGAVLLQLGRAADALAAYERALAREPENEAARSGLANALDALGRKKDAAAARAAIGQPRPEPAADAMVEAPLPAGDEPQPRHTVADAERLVQAARLAAVRADTEAEVSGYVQAGHAYVEAHCSDAALDALQRALALAPGDADVHLALAHLYFERGWRDRAVEKLVLLDRLMAIEPRPGAHDQLLALARERAPDDARLAALFGGASAGASP